jgi:hypothetical protein
VPAIRAAESWNKMVSDQLARSGIHDPSIVDRPRHQTDGERGGGCSACQRCPILLISDG